MMMFGRLLLAAALSFAALPALAQTKPKVVATFSILGDLVAQVAGDRIDLAVLVGADTDAHTYQPKPSDARTLAAAQAMVSNGLGFEGWIDRLAEAAPFKGRPIVATAGVPTLEASSPGYGHNARPRSALLAGCRPRAPLRRQHRRGPGRQPIPRMPRTIASVRGPTTSGSPSSTNGSRRRSPRCRPASARRSPAMTSFRYFAQAYGVQFQAPRGYNTNSEPSAKDVAALIRLVREQKIKALFVENMTNPGLVDQIARESGAVVGPRLYSDALSAPGGPAPTYEAMMRHNVTALVAGMLKN